MSHFSSPAVTSDVIVVLHIKRASGSTEVHELPTDGDHVTVPFGLLDAEDVLGFDIEIPALEALALDLVGADLGGCVGARAVG